MHVRLLLPFLAAFALGPLPRALADPPRPAAPPLRLAIAGLVHGHVWGFLRNAAGNPEVQLVGVAEEDAGLRSDVVQQFGLEASATFATLEEMLDRVKPDAVAVFTTTADHPGVVEACARRRIPVMLEKPFANSVADADRIRRAAETAGIQLIVNYETTWYPSLVTAADVLKNQRGAGPVRRMIATVGHPGPRELGVGPEFLSWLTDPSQNGGALFDLGSYGASVMTWLMAGERPRAVTAVQQQFRPSVYPKVADDATLLLEYPGAIGIVQASWNSPTDRKDFEIYTDRAFAVVNGGGGLRLKLPGKKEETREPPALPADEGGPLAYFVAVARGRVIPSGRPSLASNIIVTEILEAARQSAETGRRIELK